MVGVHLIHNRKHPKDRQAQLQEQSLPVERSHLLRLLQDLQLIQDRQRDRHLRHRTHQEANLRPQGMQVLHAGGRVEHAEDIR